MDPGCKHTWRLDARSASFHVKIINLIERFESAAHPGGAGENDYICIWHFSGEKVIIIV